MALDDTQRTDAMRDLARRLFQETGATATMDTDQIKAAVAALDDALDTSLAEMATAVGPTKTLAQALALSLPEPFGSVTTLPQKAVALAVVVMKIGGLI